MKNVNYNFICLFNTELMHIGEHAAKLLYC